MKYRLLLLSLCLSACSLQSASLPTPFPTATTVSAQPTPTQTATPAPTVTATPPPPTLTTAPTSTHTPAPTATDDACGSNAQPAHTVQAQVDYAAKTVSAQQRIRYTNRTAQPLASLVLNVEPNRWLDAFTLQSLTLGETETDADYDLTGRRLEVALPGPLLPGCQITLSLRFSLEVPPIIGGPEAFRGYFGQTVRQINLGHWLPTIAPRLDSEWLQHEAVLIGEQIVLEQADWEVTFTLVNAPDEAIVAAPGELLARNGPTWAFRHTNGREFAASISHTFRQSTATSTSGVTVDVYTFPDALVPNPDGGDWLDGGAYAAKISAESVALFADKFGPYPHPRLVIVQGDFPDGMEFSGFAFVSTDWFTSYVGSPRSYLMLITVHEVAHQWWYDIVGSDQAYDPWLDEALSTYSEYIYIEAYEPEIADWWWWFRVNRLNPQGAVGSSVYDFQQIRPYINAVYLRGVLMLHEVRTLLGDDAFYAWLRRYAETNNGFIADADDLWSLLTPAQQEAAANVRATFFR